MKKIYVKPSAETIDFSIEEVLMNGGIIDGSIDVGYGEGPEDED